MEGFFLQLYFDQSRLELAFAKEARPNPLEWATTELRIAEFLIRSIRDLNQSRLSVDLNSLLKLVTCRRAF